MDCISYLQKDQHRVAGLSPTTLTHNSSVALGFSVSLSFPLSGVVLPILRNSGFLIVGN
ncbi:hypothetical protein KY284_032499 [Solanum tuberosum]|nr:hypothetical protein KY284_032499 [Solanum tuberosum]